MISQVEEKVESVEDDVSELRTIMRKFAKRQKRQEDLITRLRAGESTPQSLSATGGAHGGAPIQVSDGELESEPLQTGSDVGYNVRFNVSDDEAPTNDRKPSRLNRQGTMGILQRSDSVFHYKDL